MATKSILLAVAEPQAQVEITQALGAEWEPISVASEADALAQLEQRAFDALLVDFNLGSPDASELLNQSLDKRPETLRFLLAYEADLALVAAKVLGTPHILPKPVEPVSLASRIQTAINDSNSKPSESKPADEPSDLPAIPPIYSEVLRAIESLGVTDQQIGEIIAHDAALTSEVLRLTNSSYLGLPRNITDPVEAVESLGLEAVKAIVMSLQFLAEHGRLKPGYLSLDQLWQHSVSVAQLARDLVLFETKDRTLASQALMAGLVHDLGKVVLATNFDDLYGRVHSLARKQPVALWDVEKEMFGANHGEIGACLVGMWNMPSAVVEAAALHHEPPLGEQEHLTALAAVHIANVLERELCSADEGMMVAPIISTPFLNDLGLLQRLPVWRAAFANGRSGHLEPEFEPAETDQGRSAVLTSTAGSRTANQLTGPGAATRTTTSGAPRWGAKTSSAHAARSRRSWVYAGAAGVLVLLALWFRTQPELNETEPAYARTPVPHEAPAIASPARPPETAPVAAAPVVAASEESPATAAPSQTASKPAAALPPAAESTAATAPQATVTNAPAQAAATQEKPMPEFHLSAIFYTSVRPSAIVNGQTVNVGDDVNGATVVSIARTSVTLQIDGHRKTCELR